ncbi:hypothetical protein D3C81_2055830 [compost metagenome]
MLPVGGKRQVMNLSAAKAAVDIHTIALQRKYIIVMGNDFHREVCVIRIIGEPDCCFNTFAPQHGNLIKR